MTMFQLPLLVGIVMRSGIFGKILRIFRFLFYGTVYAFGNFLWDRVRLPKVFPHTPVTF